MSGNQRVGIAIATMFLIVALALCGSATMFLSWFFKPAAEAPVAEAPVAEAPVAETSALVQTCTLADGKLYQFSPLENGEIWQTTEFLAQAKIQGAVCNIVIPNGMYAVVNQSAGIVSINGNIANLGNPVFYNGNSHVTGTVISSWGENDSAGTLITIFQQ